MFEDITIPKQMHKCSFFYFTSRTVWRVFFGNVMHLYGCEVNLLINWKFASLILLLVNGKCVLSQIFSQVVSSIRIPKSLSQIFFKVRKDDWALLEKTALNSLILPLIVLDDINISSSSNNPDLNVLPLIIDWITFLICRYLKK